MKRLPCAAFFVFYHFVLRDIYISAGKIPKLMFAYSI